MIVTNLPFHYVALSCSLHGAYMARTWSLPCHCVVLYQAIPWIFPGSYIVVAAWFFRPDLPWRPPSNGVRRFGRRTHTLPVWRGIGELWVGEWENSQLSRSIE